MACLLKAVPDSVLIVNDGSEIVERHCCQMFGLSSLPCCVCHIDVERWFFKEFLSASSVRKPQGGLEGLLLDRRSIFKNRNIRNLKINYKTEREKITQETGLENLDYENRCRKYGNLPLAILGHIYNLEFRKSSIDCLDHVIRLETVVKILFALSSHDIILSTGYIQIREVDIKEALLKIEDILINYDFSHFTDYIDNITHCNFCSDYGFLHIFGMLTSKIVSFRRTVLKSHKDVAEKMRDLNRYVSNFLTSARGRRDWNKLLHRMNTGYDYYAYVHSYTEIYSDKSYSLCTLLNHNIDLPQKIVFVYSLLARKLRQVPAAEQENDFLSDKCAICLKRLGGRESSLEINFCPYIYCGDSFKSCISPNIKKHK